MSQELHSLTLPITSGGTTTPTEFSVDYILDIASPLSIEWNTGKLYDRYGILTPTANTFVYTNIIDIGIFDSVTFSVWITNSTSVVLYNNEKVKVSTINGTSSTVEKIEQTINSNDYRYIALCSFTDNTHSYSAHFDGRKNLKTDISEIFEHSNLTNYISGFYDNKYIDGGNTRRGLLETYNGFYATKPVELNGSTSYYFNGIFTKYYAFFDANMNWISGAANVSGDTALTNPFTTPSEAKYGVFTCLNESNKNNAWIYTSNAKPSEHKYNGKKLELSENPVDYNGNEVNTFFLGIACGDSLTEGTFNTGSGVVNHQQYSYPFQFYKKTNVYLRNFGVGGSTAQSWYERYQNTAFPAYDFAIIAFGVNDLLQDVSPSTTVQYLGNIVTKLKTANAGVKCFIATVNKAYNTAGSAEDYEAMNTAIRTFANTTVGCYLVDIAKYGKTETGTAYVNGHLTALGYTELAREYANLISWTMKNKPTDFSSIQFSGTDIANIPSDLRELLRITQ